MNELRTTEIAENGAAGKHDISRATVFEEFNVRAN